MLGIVKKDLFWFAIASLVLLPIALIVERLVASEASPLVIGLNSFLLATLVIGPVLIAEQDEEKSNGYGFLGSLPVTRREIVVAKFALPLIPLAASAAGGAALNRSWAAPAEWVAIGDSAIILTGMASLAICGLAYICIMGFGYTRFFLGATVAVVTLSLAPPFVLHSGFFQPRAMIEWLAGALVHLNRPLFIAGGLGMYAALMLLASAAMGFEPNRRRSG